MSMNPQELMAMLRRAAAEPQTSAEIEQRVLAATTKSPKPDLAEIEACVNHLIANQVALRTVGLTSRIDDLNQTFVPAILEAAKLGRVEVLKILLDPKTGISPDITATGLTGTALMSAAYCGQVMAVAYLLKRGAKPNLTSKTATALHFAILPESSEVAAGFLISKNQKSRLTKEQHDKCVTIVQLLLTHKADPNAKKESGVTPLMNAAELGSLALVNILLKSGARPEDKDNENWSAAVRAIKIDRPDILEVLVNTKGFPIDEVFELVQSKADSKDPTVIKKITLLDIAAHENFKTAASERNPVCIQVLLKAGAKVTDFAIQKIIGSNSSETLKVLIDCPRFNLEEVLIEDGLTPLILAAHFGYSKSLECLILAKANLDAQSKPDEETALMRAARHGHFECVDRLLKAGASHHLISKKGYTALLAAVRGRHLLIVQRILQEKPDLNVPQVENNLTPLNLAIFLGDATIAACLLEAGADITVPCHLKKKGGGTVEYSALTFACIRKQKAILEQILRSKQFLSLDTEAREMMHYQTFLYAIRHHDEQDWITILAKGLDLNKVFSGKDNYTSLLVVTKAGSLQGVTRLLQMGADVNQTNSAGLSALMVAAINRYSKIVSFLITAGAKLDAQSSDGGTALMRACSVGDEDSVRALLAAGAKTEIKDTEERTALMMATLNGRSEIIEILCKEGRADIEAADNEGITPLSQAHDPKTAKTLMALGAKGKPNRCLFNFYMLLMCFDDIPKIQSYLEVFNINDFLELSKVDGNIQKLGPFFLCANHRNRDIKFLVLKHKLYADYGTKIDKTKIDAVVELLNKICSDIGFVEDGTLYLKIDNNDVSREVNLGSEGILELAGLLDRKAFSEIESLRAAIPREIASNVRKLAILDLQLSEEILSLATAGIALQYNDITEHSNSLTFSANTSGVTRLQTAMAEVSASQERKVITETKAVTEKNAEPPKRKSQESAETEQYIQYKVVKAKLFCELKKLDMLVSKGKELKHICTVLSRAEESIDKLMSEEEFIEKANAVSQKIARIADIKAKPTEKLSISAIDTDAFLETLSQIEITTPGLLGIENKIKRLSLELDVFREYLLENPKKSLNNHDLKAAIGFCLARLEIFYAEIKSKATPSPAIQKIADQYKAFIPTGQDFQISNSAWIFAVDMFIRECLKQLEVSNTDSVAATARTGVEETSRVTAARVDAEGIREVETFLPSGAPVAPRSDRARNAATEQIGIASARGPRGQGAQRFI